MAKLGLIGLSVPKPGIIESLIRVGDGQFFRMHRSSTDLGQQQAWAWFLPRIESGVHTSLGPASGMRQRCWPV